MVSAAAYRPAMTSGRSTSRMSAPLMATAPGVSTCRAAFSVMTVPPTTTSEAARRAGCAAATAAIASATATNSFGIRGNCISPPAAATRNVAWRPASETNAGHEDTKTRRGPSLVLLRDFVLSWLHFRKRAPYVLDTVRVRFHHRPAHLSSACGPRADRESSSAAARASGGWAPRRANPRHSYEERELKRRRMSVRRVLSQVTSIRCPPAVYAPLPGGQHHAHARRHFHCLRPAARPRRTRPQRQ